MIDSIVLNIGGHIFQTTRNTLREVQFQKGRNEHLLYTLFSDETNLPIGTDESGRIFIDRDGSNFEYILNYLRYQGSIEYLSRTIFLIEDKKLLNRLILDADFFMLEELCECLKDRLSEIEKKKNEIVGLNIGGHIFQTTRSTLTLGEPHSPNYFTKILSGVYSADYDNQGNIFIDRDGAIFHFILSYLRERRYSYGTQALRKLAHIVPDSLLESLREDSRFYELHEIDRDFHQIMNFKICRS